MNTAEAIADLRNLTAIARTAGISSALRQSVEIIRSGPGGIADNFAGSHAPDGTPWPERKNIGDGHPLLIDEGWLRAAALGVGPGQFTDVNAREADIGIDTSVKLGGVQAADVHNDGLGNMPQREFFAPNETALDAVGEVIGNAMLEKLLAGGGAI